MVTVEELRYWPEPKDGTFYELRDGRAVKVATAGLRHQRAARELMLQLRSLAGSNGEVYGTFYFRALPEYDARRVDVGYISAERYANAVGADDFFGGPDLVVEILSRQTEPAELDEKKAPCLANGCQEFWVVDLESESMQVSHCFDCVLPIAVDGLDLEELFA